MKRNSVTVFALFMVGLIATFFSAQIYAEKYQLEQVLIMSRHNLRAPLADNGSVLEQSTARSWPHWDVPGGQLTTKGGVLEVYMGHYFHEWFARQGLIKNNECPKTSDVYAYANSLQRTVATAQFFITGAFPGCKIPVHHHYALGTMDPTFSPVITNTSVAFRQNVVRAMARLQENNTLIDSYKLLENVADYGNAPACKMKNQCDLTTQKNIFSANLMEEPNVSGPLKVGNSLVDAFTLQYYEGFPQDEVAWGQIKSDEQWRVLSRLKNSYQDTLFSLPDVAQNVAAPLLKYLQQTLINETQNAPAMTILVGHDSNIAALLTSLDIKAYQLPGQYERTPIGGKIVFQRWRDNRNNQDVVKIEYIYQSAEQLREGRPLSLKHPPQRVTLQLAGCAIDDNGFCQLQDFARIINQAVKQ